MGKKQTISTRWKEWTKKEPVWAYSALACFLIAMVGLTVHLGVLGGWVRYAGLWVLILGDAGAITITAIRKQWWWCSFFIFITVGVIGWELASFFFGSLK